MGPFTRPRPRLSRPAARASANISSIVPPQVCIFLLCMPIIAAPLEAIAVLGSSSPVCILEQVLILFAGFVLAGVPLYYITHRNEGRAQCEWTR